MRSKVDYELLSNTVSATRISKTYIKSYLCQPTSSELPKTSKNSTESNIRHEETKRNCKKKLIWVFTPNFLSLLTGDWIRKIKPIKVCSEKVVRKMKSPKSISSVQNDKESSLFSSTTSTSVSVTSTPSTMNDKIEVLGVQDQNLQK